MARLRDDAGFTLIEVLVAASLMIVVLSATLTSFNDFGNNVRKTSLQNEQHDQLRLTLDQLIRQTRNLANPTTGGASATATTIAYAGRFKLIFQTADPTKEWVSYCVNYTTSATREKIWYQTSTSTSLTPDQVAGTASVAPTTMATGCPSTDSHWAGKRVVGDYVTNQASSTTTRPVFRYYTDDGTELVPAASPVDSSLALDVTPQIVRVDASVFVRVDLSHGPPEAQLSSAAFLRNQNQKPTASFVAKQGSSSTYTFDAGDSTDPEGRTLRYDWYQAPAGMASSDYPSSPSVLPDCSLTAADQQYPPSGSAGSDWACIGTDVVMTHTFDSLTQNPQNVFLRVTDPGNLQSLSSFPNGGCLSTANALRVETDCGEVTGGST